MDLLQVVNHKVVPSIHALRTEPFKSIWEEDESPDKEYAMKVFDYVEFLCSPKKSNPYFGKIDDENRIRAIKRAVFKNEHAEINEEIAEACEVYIDFLHKSSPSYGLVIDGMQAAYNLRTFLGSVDYTATTTSGAMKIKPNDVVSALNRIPLTMKNLETAREELLSGLMEEAGKTRGGREKGEFED